MSLFDDIQKAAFSTTLTVFGDKAVWVSSVTQEEHTADVHFKNPNDLVSIGSQDKFEYRPYDYTVEYYQGSFPGLKESVENGSIEKLTVNGFNLIIREVRAKFDGKTLTAYAELLYD